MTIKFVIGLDIGQLNERSALSIVEEVPAPAVQQFDGSWPRAYQPDPEPPSYHCLHLQVWNPGTRHVQIFDDVLQLIGSAPQLHDNVHVAMDITTAGEAAGVEFRRLLRNYSGGVPLTTFEIMSSIASADGYDHIRISRRELASMLRVQLEAQRLHVASGLQHGDDMLKEMANFKIEKIAVDDNALDWRMRPHEDLVRATAIALWQHQKKIGPLLLFASYD